MGLSGDQLLAITVSERTMSVLSLAGSLFIMATFLKWEYFRKPINRLVFYASFGNVMANVATLISTSALSSPFSALCEFQGILVQWFMMADSLWVFCMALNVMLVFFRNYNSDQLRHLEKWYALFSYGVPFIPCMAFIIIDHYGTHRIIGPATIWCWVGPESEWMRIAFFYAPVWILVGCTLVIYICTGRRIFKKRAILRSFSRRSPTEPVSVIMNPFTDVAAKTIHVQNDIHIHVTTRPPYPNDMEPTDESPTFATVSRSSFSSTNNLSSTIEPPMPAPQTTRSSRADWTSSTGGTISAENEKPEITKCSYRATVSATNAVADLEAAYPSTSATQSRPPIRRTVAMEGNTGAWGYFKVAFLMFAALFIVWVPSTINRVQQFVNKGSPVFGLNLASALVLPLQGFWNAMIYMSTTWPECKRAFAETLYPSLSATDYRSSDLDRKTSQRTVSTDETQGYGAEIPLDEMLKQTITSRIHSRMSSSETMHMSPDPQQNR